MVFLYPNPTPKPQELYLDPTKIDLTGLNPIPTNAITTTTTSTTAAAVCTTTNTTAFSAEDPTHKKVRKPYTITKSRESWTDQEHDKFLEALHLFDRDWKKIEAFVGTKTVIQIRSHAQKYFLKVQKNGTSEHLPPPRPKRKASHPYPQKASKKAPVVSQVPGPFPSSSASLEPALASWNYSCVTPVSVSHAMKGDTGLTIPTDAHNSSYTSSNESDQRIWPTGDASDQERRNHGNQMRVMPDFAQVYSFIGSVFDPNASGHLQKLKKMDPIDMETALLLMKNLSDNLKSPEFENYRRLLSSDDVDAKKAKINRPFNNLCATRPQRAIPTA